jgi:hypothetical protein
MGWTPEPPDLTSHHRTTLTKILQHPASHNITWRDVESLLNAVGSIERHHDNKVTVTVGSKTRSIDLPQHKDVGVDTIVELRRLLIDAGYGTD